MCGILGGAAFTYFVGHYVAAVGYVTIFTIVGLLHLLATTVILLLIGSKPPVFPSDHAFPVLTPPQSTQA